MTIPAFWWDGQPNFGDALTAPILAEAGLDVAWAPADEAKIIGVGSVLEHVSEDSPALIFGSGFQFPNSRKRFRRARIFALRGAYSARNAGLDASSILLGDPGILFCGPAVSERFRVGIVPHYVDRADPRLVELQQNCGSELQIIDVRTNNPAFVRDRIAECHCIISSSLHGLIVALSLGKPACWVELSDRVLGNGFKFRDFYSAFGIAAVAQTLKGSEKTRDLEALCFAPPASLAKRKEQFSEELRRLNPNLLEPG